MKHISHTLADLQAANDRQWKRLPLAERRSRGAMGIRPSKEDIFNAWRVMTVIRDREQTQMEMILE